MNKYSIIAVVIVVLTLGALFYHLATKPSLEEKKETFKKSCEKIFGYGNVDLKCTKTKCLCVPFSCIANMSISYEQCTKYVEENLK